MRRVMFATAALVLSAAVGVAQDPPPKVQPVPAPKVILPVQPGQPAGWARGTTAAAMARLEEEVETLEANRDVKRAYLRVAEASVRIPLAELERVEGVFKAGVATKDEFERAKANVDIAKAQVEVRAAELKEVEVKIKHAKKRLDEAKAAGVRPAPAPKPVDPPPPPPPNMKDVDPIDAKLARWKPVFDAIGGDRTDQLVWARLHAAEAAIRELQKELSERQSKEYDAEIKKFEAEIKKFEAEFKERIRKP